MIVKQQPPLPKTQSAKRETESRAGIVGMLFISGCSAVKHTILQDFLVHILQMTSYVVLPNWAVINGQTSGSSWDLVHVK